MNNKIIYFVQQNNRTGKSNYNIIFIYLCTLFYLAALC